MNAPRASLNPHAEPFLTRALDQVLLMRRVVLPLLMGMTTMAACGGTSTDEADPGGAVVDRQEPGTAVASVDGRQFAFEEPGGLACVVSDDEVSFSFRIGDNEAVLGGGASISGGQWFGSITLRVLANNEVTEYAAKLIDNPSALAVDGNSVSYSGPMERFDPTEPGTLPEPVDVGTGTFSATCG